MKKINIITYLILILINISCTSEKQIFGLYGKCPKSYFGCSQFLINSDSTFQHYIFMDVGGANFINGKWTKINNNKFLLNTYEQPLVANTHYASNLNNDLKNKVQILIIEKKSPVPGFTVKLNNEYTTTDFNGIATFNVQEVEKITIYFLSYEEEIQIIPSDKAKNNFTIYIRDLNHSVIPYFYTNKIISFKNKRIYIDNDYSLKKTTFKNKQW